MMLKVLSILYHKVHNVKFNFPQDAQNFEVCVRMENVFKNKFFEKTRGEFWVILQWWDEDYDIILAKTYWQN